MKKNVLLFLALAAGLTVRAELDQAILMDEAKLIEVIQKADTTDNDKVTACQNLGWCGTKTAIAPLAALLSSRQGAPAPRGALRAGDDLRPRRRDHAVRSGGQALRPRACGRVAIDAATR